MSDDIVKKQFSIGMVDIVPPAEITELNEMTGILIPIETVDSDTAARRAKSAVKDAKAAVKLIADRRMDLTRKVDEWKKSVIAQERELTAAANAQIERVNGLVAGYVTAKAEAEAAARAAEEAARLEEQRKAQLAAEAESALTGKAVVAPVVAQETEEKQKPIVRGVTARTMWTFSVTDPDAVPRAYCVPDLKLIREYMETARKSGAAIETLSVPGVEFRKEIHV